MGSSRFLYSADIPPLGLLWLSLVVSGLGASWKYIASILRINTYIYSGAAQYSMFIPTRKEDHVFMSRL